MSMRTERENVNFCYKIAFFRRFAPFKFHAGRRNRTVYVVFESKADRLSQKHPKHTNTAASTRLFSVEALNVRRICHTCKTTRVCRELFVTIPRRFHDTNFRSRRQTNCTRVKPHARRP